MSIKNSVALQKLLELFTPSGTWIRDDLARDAEGAVRSPFNPESVCWCLTGGMDKISDQYKFDLKEMITSLVDCLQPKQLQPHLTDAENLQRFNDVLAASKSDVIDLIKRASNKATQLTLKNEAQRALDLQDACNLKGVIVSFTNARETILDHGGRDKGTNWFNHHPIMVMYACKIADLCGLSIRSDPDTFSKSYKLCEQMSQGDTICY